MKLAHFYWKKNEIHEVFESLKEYYPKILDTKAEKYFSHTRILQRTSVYVCALFSFMTPLFLLIVYFISRKVMTPVLFPTSLIAQSVSFMALFTAFNQLQ
jgi:hypothetical protein